MAKTETRSETRKLPPGVRPVGVDKFKLTVYAGIGPNGKQRQMTRTFTARTEKELRKGYRQAADEIEKVIEDGKRETGTVKELAHAWVKHRAPRDSPATVAKRKRIVDRIIRDLGHHRVDKLTARHVDEWIAALRTTPVARNHGAPMLRSESTVQHYFRVLAAMLRQAERWGMAGAPVTRNADKPKKADTHPRPPTRAALNALLADATITVHMSAYLAAVCGLRRGEIVGLRWTDIRREQINGKPRWILHVQRAVVETSEKGRDGKLHAKLHVKPPKSRRDRKIPLHRETVRVLTRYRRTLRRREGFGPSLDGYVIPDTSDKSWQTGRRPNWVTLMWARHCERHGVNVRFHDLRHFYVTNLLDQGTPTPAAQYLAGHSQPSTTLNVYASPVDAAIVAAAETAARALPVGGATSQKAADRRRNKGDTTP